MRIAAFLNMSFVKSHKATSLHCIYAMNCLFLYDDMVKAFFFHCILCIVNNKHLPRVVCSSIYLAGLSLLKSSQ